MNIWTDKKKRERLTECVFYILVFAAITCFAMLQTYGDPPDEINRFKIVNYIMRHGRLPHGADPEVIIAGYGASYAFQPILTYIIQGFLLRFLRLFTQDGYILLLSARMVNVIFGVCMAYFVRKAAKEAWKSPYLQWSFTIMVVFLPQNLFLHSYVNTDSMAMLSVAMIFYVLLKVQRTGYGKKECVLLALGIVLCAMSYYNAYGIIVAAMLLFVIHYISVKEGRLSFDYREMLRAGIFISVLVLAGIGWWFVRNGILYGGDLFAMKARQLCAIETASPDYNPLTRFTYQGAGESLQTMIFTTGYLTLMRDSFIAMFGPMIIPTHGLIYLYYKRFWIVAGIAALLPVSLVIKDNNKSGCWERAFAGKKKDFIAFYAGMALFSLLTIGLAVYYSYTWEFQPQGRYILPVLIPMMYLITIGMQKICLLLELVPKAGLLLGKCFCLGVMAYVMLSFAYSLFVRFVPYYLEGENMLSMMGKAFVP